jgi:dihydropteroate synthase
VNARKLRHRDGILALGRTAIMGVLNVTPDSFSDGGLWFKAEDAVRHALEMVDEGADIIDVGGESTRPGAEAVSLEEELRRVIPVIETVHAEVDVPISIDTRKPEVARRAIDAGAAIVNDTAGEDVSTEMDRAVADTGAGYVIMHSRGAPDTMRALTDYDDDVVTHVRDFLERRVAEARSAGVAADAIAIDPGIGFAKTPVQSLRLLRETAAFVDIGVPVLIGTSRKSFIGAVLDVPEDERLEGTLASIVWSVSRGAAIVRVHDVTPAVRSLRLLEAILDATHG